VETGSRSGQSGQHPLFAGSEDVNKQISSSDLHGKEVVVSGSYYPSTGLIFASSVRAAQ
jgi:hypothetical protein